jgi:hypothetical protein
VAQVLPVRNIVPVSSETLVEFLNERVFESLSYCMPVRILGVTFDGPHEAIEVLA